MMTGPSNDGGHLLPDPPGMVSSGASIIELNIGGIHYTASLSTLRRDQNSMLALMFRDGQIASSLDRNGSVFIDRDGSLFRYVLAYLRDGMPPKGVDRETRLALQAEAAFYQVEGLQAWASQADSELSPWEASANTVKQAVDAATQDLERFAKSVAHGWFQTLHEGIALAPPTQGVQSLVSLGKFLSVWIVGTPLRFVLLLLALLGLPLGLTVVARRSFAQPVVGRHWVRLNVGGQVMETTDDVLCGNGVDPRKYTRVLRYTIPAGTAAHYAWARASGRLYCAAEGQRRALPRNQAATRCGGALRAHANATMDAATLQGDPGESVETLLLNHRLHRLVSDCSCSAMFQIRFRDEGTFLQTGALIRFDRDPTHFRHILNFLRDGALPQRLTENARAELCREVGYYMIPGLLAWCRLPANITERRYQEESMSEVYDIDFPLLHPLRTVAEAALSISAELLSPAPEAVTDTSGDWLSAGAESDADL